MSKLFLLNFAEVNEIFSADWLTFFLENMRRANSIRPYQNRPISSSSQDEQTILNDCD